MWVSSVSINWIRISFWDGIYVKVTSASKHSMPYLAKKVAQLTKKLSLTSIFSCCLRFSSPSIPAMFVDLITPEWSARVKKEAWVKKFVCRKYIIYVYDVDMNISKTWLKRKYRILRRTSFLWLLMNLTKQTNYSFRIIIILHS